MKRQPNCLYSPKEIKVKNSIECLSRPLSSSGRFSVNCYDICVYSISRVTVNNVIKCILAPGTLTYWFRNLISLFFITRLKEQFTVKYTDLKVLQVLSMNFIYK